MYTNDLWLYKCDVADDTGKFMTFPDAEHVQEMYGNHQMYYSAGIYCTNDVVCNNFQYCTGLISDSVNDYRTYKVSWNYPYANIHMHGLECTYS